LSFLLQNLFFVIPGVQSAVSKHRRNQTCPIRFKREGKAHPLCWPCATNVLLLYYHYVIQQHEQVQH